MRHMSSGPKSLAGIKRKALTVSQSQFVKEGFLRDDEQLPLVITPQIEGIDLSTWITDQADWLKANLRRYGGVLFRGFPLFNLEDFNLFIKNTSVEIMDYHEGASPRTRLRENIYTSTDYPAEYRILLHNELSYRHVFPQQIFFFCLTPALEHGETPIADVRKVLEYISPKTREMFIQKGWKLVRNLGSGFGLAWQDVYHTDNKAEVETYCRQHGISFEWKEGDRLRTSHIRPSIARHPQTGEIVWFNHAAFFHVSSLEPGVRKALTAEFSEQDLPTNTYYGDGSSIEPEVLDELRAAYNRATVTFPWQQGDLLMLDNILAAHGRAAFTGKRKILVGMSNPCSWDQTEVK
jgi:alpha-ketoglutarate-dependent taurine dioxygenase